MSGSEQIIKVEGMPIGAGFNWSVGALMEKFIAALADKKLLAAKCPACGYVVTPPRTRCPRCSGKIAADNLVALSGQGKIIARTLASARLDGKCNFVDLKAPIIIAAVKLDGADSTLFLPLDAAPEKAEIGATVRVKWNAELKGEISDLAGVQLA